MYAHYINIDIRNRCRGLPILWESPTTITDNTQTSKRLFAINNQVRQVWLIHFSLNNVPTLLSITSWDRVYSFYRRRKVLHLYRVSFFRARKECELERMRHGCIFMGIFPPSRKNWHCQVANSLEFARTAIGCTKLYIDINLITCKYTNKYT